MSLKSMLIIFIFVIGSGNLCAVDLSGKWVGDDGGTYYLRQIGDQLYWFGENNVSNPRWANVFLGRIQDDRVEGKWTDVPKGQTVGNGTLLLEIINDGNSLKAKEKTGGFGGSNLNKLPPPIVIKLPSKVNKPPNSLGMCSIAGHLTGEIRFTKTVALYSQNDIKRPYLTTLVDKEGGYYFSNLPPGNYKVVPLPGGKYDLKMLPIDVQSVECTDGGKFSIDFKIEGIEEG
jgi:hypothetical protein